MYEDDDDIVLPITADPTKSGENSAPAASTPATTGGSAMAAHAESDAIARFTQALHSGLMALDLYSVPHVDLGVWVRTGGMV